MAGRPIYEPTPADRRTVLHLVAARVDQEEIAKCIGTHGITSKTLRKHFRRELDTAKAMQTATAMSKLSEAIDNGESWAITLWLKCRQGWGETQSFQHSGPNGGPIVTSDITTLRSEISAATASLTTEQKCVIAQRLNERDQELCDDDGNSG